MSIEEPYEMEWSLLQLMLTRAVSPVDAGEALGVTVPTALTSLQHLESIGMVWQLPLDGGGERSLGTRDWEITPTGHTMTRARGAEAAPAPRRRAIVHPLSRVQAA
jgi:hypothetical protein